MLTGFRDFVLTKGRGDSGKVESGEWRVESGKWKVESGKWKVFFVLTGFRDFVLTKGCVMGEWVTGF